MTKHQWPGPGKKACAAAIACAMLTGCTFGSGGASGPGGSMNTGDLNARPSISMMLDLTDREPPKDTLIRPLEVLTQTRLAFNWVPDNIYTDKMVSAIATGAVPKVIQVRAADLKHPAVVNGVQAGLFWEIGPLLGEYPLINRYMNKAIAANSTYFGKMYGLYLERPLSRQGIQYRKDWLDRLGLPEPKTLEDVYTVLKAFTYNDPDGNGEQDTYGLIDRNDPVYGAFKNIATYFGTPNGWGMKDGKLTPDFMSAEYMNAMKFMKKLYDEKLMNPDFTVTSKTQQENRFIAGEAGMMISNVLAASIQSRLQETNPDAKVEIQNRIRGPKGERAWGGTGIGGLLLFPKASVKTESELKQVLAFFEKTLSKDVNNLITYGIRDRHYKQLDADTISVLPGTKRLREQEVESYANALRTFDIQYLRQGQIGALQEKIIGIIKDNDSIVVGDPTAAFVSRTQAEKGTGLADIVTNATYDFILGRLDEAGFRRELEKWRKEGGDLIIEEMNRQYAELNK
ncbi:extracellular solute-binding protein [Paenibacillus hamazuiensis]|uniref:extracellular solute-binding protein n=1 Tax=Paenibacillus hamazuiensis TaxID=2936508 RepID=UPI00200EFD60|nr:extracellular solute-binding protein [Paenibacillus hamazuiensis]